MTNHYRAVIIAGTLVALAAGPAAAQRDSAIAAGVTVRTSYCPAAQVTRKDGLEGILVSLDSRVVMVQSEDLHRLPMDRTLSLERKTGESHHFIGILIGAPLGALIGARVGRPSQAEMRSTDGMAEMGILVGAFLGAISGALVGSSFTGANWTAVPLPAGAGSGCAIPSVRRPRTGAW